MSIAEDFKKLKQDKEVAELAIKIRAEMEYCKRVLEEHLTSWDEDIKNVNWESIPEPIRAEGAIIKKKFQMLVDDLNTKHSEFLTLV